MKKDRVFEICDAVREIGLEVHSFLGPGHLEKIYERAMANRLRKRGLSFEQQFPLDVQDEDGSLLGEFVADIFVDDRLLVELKAARAVAPEHVSQLLGYMRAARVEHGVLDNFGGPRFYIKKYVLSSSPPRLQESAPEEEYVDQHWMEISH